MKTYVISLAQAAERRARMREQLDCAGCPYQIFGAIAGADGYDFFERLDRKRYLINTGRAPSDGEIGCYASHLYLWNLCVALDEPIIIMEDDAELDARYADALAVVADLIDRYGFIRLQESGAGRRLRRIVVETRGEFALSYCRRFPYGAICYAIAPSVATAFIRASRVVVGPVDFLIKQSWMHRCPLYALSPPVVRGSELRRDSTIGHRGKPRLSVMQRLRRLLGKLRTAIFRALFNLHRSGRRRRALQG